ncbi:hypothetical protein AAZX31_19G086500 [Glycine max]
MVRFVGAALSLRTHEPPNEQLSKVKVRGASQQCGCLVVVEVVLSRRPEERSVSQISPLSLRYLSPEQSTVILAEVKVRGASQQRGFLFVAEAGGAQRVAAEDLQISILQYSVSVSVFQTLICSHFCI